MKKIAYIAPEMEDIKISMNQLICASDGSSSEAGLDDEYSDEDPA